eukprot:CAMPEP_0167787852 /NCGR_PEP_ID=MMETSP0111_2-20121227/9678_1 /TAXON_ID=91324 /ORGANISM="Lotharella globosa, Strain CCCM811" /LENGTH=303 /DNA_ID=CAMNT_0007679591 /DNA_START=32 /DNA_END=944 /DNA_ORIENTATION=-
MRLVSNAYILCASISCLASWSTLEDSGSEGILHADSLGKLPLHGFFFGVMTAPDNYEIRDAIREGWMKLFVREGASYRFFIGSEGLEESHLRKINETGDVVGLSFVDSYMNLTRKTEGAANWTVSNRQIKYFIKIDDDVYPSLDTFKQMASMFQPEKFYAGRKMENFSYMTEGKFALPNKFRSMFKDGKYPPYSEGPMYIMSSDVLPYLGAHFDPNRSDEETFPFEDINSGLILRNHKVEPTTLYAEKAGMLLSHHYTPDEAPGGGCSTVVVKGPGIGWDITPWMSIFLSKQQLPKKVKEWPG